MRCLSELLTQNTTRKEASNMEIVSTSHKDMGNCMDYTNTHENNQLPDRSNFLFLERMYGSLDGTSQYNSTTEDKGLYCSSADEASSSSSQIFKNRFLAKGVVGDAIVTYRRDVPTI